ncbi:PREDICTED: UPF0472 protein C16orf72 homolog [Colobus angolensis palliatus]|uniref:UPF0472 protein C16orf72 homolog n=1 Tax=Colobus angolensis palliatus TaxID=336983 RepID=UPI0005F36551|nr:PREDICTED: UPF0472 protein C16orf72 homolog [Colobus angolensis palliatus]
MVQQRSCLCHTCMCRPGLLMCYRECRNAEIDISTTIANWLRQADRPKNQSRCCAQKPARGTGRIRLIGALGAATPQPGRGARAQWAVLLQSACGRGRAGTSSRRGVLRGGGDDVAQSLGWAQRCRPGCVEGSAVSGGSGRSPPSGPGRPVSPRPGEGRGGAPVTKWRRETAGRPHCALSRPRGGDCEGGASLRRDLSLVCDPEPCGIPFSPPRPPCSPVLTLVSDRVCQQPGLSLWVPFQNAATAVTNLYKESVDTHQRSFDIGIQIGYQRRNKDVLAWVKKRRRTIRREDLISFLCGKVPPPRNSRAPPRLTVVSPNRATSTETSSSVETDLQPFREAIALHGLSGAMASISVRSSTPGSPTHVSSGSNASRRRNGLHDVDLNTFISEEMALHLDNGGTRKRTSAQCGDVITDSPTHKRNRMI